MTPLRLAFLALAAWGAVHPMFWLLKHMRETLFNKCCLKKTIM